MDFPQFPSHNAPHEIELETELVAGEAELVAGEAELEVVAVISGSGGDELAGEAEGEAEGDEEIEDEEEILTGEEKPILSGAKAVARRGRLRIGANTPEMIADAANFEALFAQWKASGDPQLRERLILSQSNMVVYLARRFLDRGELSEDVLQVGMLGLVNAFDAFDASRGIRFSSFAIPSISGEIRRYFRDKVAGMRVPRHMQELYMQIQTRLEPMTQKLARSPTYAEIAHELGVEVEAVVETLELGYALEPQSLDEFVYGEEDSILSDTIGGLDPDLVAYEERAALQMALSRLTPHERRVLEMAYFEGYTQADIARQQGVSQMHISRLLRRALTELRHLLEDV